MLLPLGLLDAMHQVLVDEERAQKRAELKSRARGHH
jgi:hypothetical protein